MTKRVAVIGGGQLARMMAPAAARLTIPLKALVEDENAPTAQVLPQTLVGSARDHLAIQRLIADADVLTFEHEHVPNALLEELVRHGTAVHPGPHALLYAQDKIEMRRRLSDLGLPCPAWQPLNPFDAAEAARELEAFIAASPAGKAVVKTARGGYDGKGVAVVSRADDVAEWIAQAAQGGPQLLVETHVPFTRELAVVLARRPGGEIAVYPPVESVQRDGVCSEVIAPAPDLDDVGVEALQQIAVEIASGLDVTGVLAVELFQTADPGQPFIINELAMRPHNSGHWTNTGAQTSQFEQHLRAVADLPLGSTSTRASWTVMVNVLGSTHENPADALGEVLADGDVHVELYGKDVRPGRKLGHVTISGTDLTDVRRRARAAANTLMGEDILPLENF